MAAGKSTLAQSLARQESAICLAEDSLLSGLYPGAVMDVPSYVQYSGRIKSSLRKVIIDLLGLGVTVVLDFPANTRAQRAWLLSLAHDAGVNHTFHYLERSDEQCLAQLESRRAEQPERHSTDTEQMFNAVTQFFEPPDDSEGLSITVHTD